LAFRQAHVPRTFHLQDHFSLLLALLSAAMEHPFSVYEEGPEHVDCCRVHTKPVQVLQALVVVLYPVAAGHAVSIVTGGKHSPAKAAAAMAASAALARALEGAAGEFMPTFADLIVNLVCISYCASLIAHTIRRLISLLA
jgi:hypothetical protein